MLQRYVIAKHDVKLINLDISSGVGESVYNTSHVAAESAIGSVDSIIPTYQRAQQYLPHCDVQDFAVDKQMSINLQYSP